MNPPQKDVSQISKDPSFNDNKNTLHNSDPIISRIGIIILFLAIVLIYIFSFLKFLYIWMSEGNKGPLGLFNNDDVHQFFSQIGYSQEFRYNFIFIILGIFLISLILITAENKQVKSSDIKNKNKIIVILDDVLIVDNPMSRNSPKKKKDSVISNLESDLVDNKINLSSKSATSQKSTISQEPEAIEIAENIFFDQNKGAIIIKRSNPEEIKGDNRYKKNAYLNIEDLFKRKKNYMKFLKILNYLSVLSIISIIIVFLRSYDIFPPPFCVPLYLYTDEAHMFIDISMIIVIVNYFFRTPDFVKSFASIGFRRVYLKHFHLHESFIGLLLILGGLFLIMNGVGEGAYFERLTGIFTLFMGAFLIGRDWKDFTQGKFLSD
ncbi:MAG: hypothetical protein ACTSU2_07935 [Promethearchaeota archaeon]